MKKLLNCSHYQANLISFPHVLNMESFTIKYQRTSNKINHKRFIDLTILDFQNSESKKKVMQLKGNWKNICCTYDKGLVFL